MLADLITQVFHDYVGEVIISEMILKQFGTKISRMKKKNEKGQEWRKAEEIAD